MRKQLGVRAGALISIAILAGSVCHISAQAPALPANQMALPNADTTAPTKSQPPAPSTEIASSSPSTPEAAPPPAAVPAPLADAKAKPDVTPKTAAKDKPDESYIVGIADDLQISVWKEPDLSGPVVVRPDGMITLPVINDVYVVGLTTKQVQDILTEKLKPVVAEPQVTVIVRNIHSRKVYLVGQVGHPGAVPLTGHETVLQILAESGGPGPFAKSDKIYILRQVGDHQEKLHFDYKKALKGADPKSDFELSTGDVIVVP
jgi:polysaccharide biosynthesis/export protein